MGRPMRRNRFSFTGRKPSFSWLSSTSSINSTTPVKGAPPFRRFSPNRFQTLCWFFVCLVPTTGLRTIFLVVAAFLLTWLPMLVLALTDVVVVLARLDWTPPDWLDVAAMWSMCAGSTSPSVKLFSFSFSPSVGSWRIIFAHRYRRFWRRRRDCLKTFTRWDC